MKLKLFLSVYIGFACLLKASSYANEMGSIVLHLEGFKTNQGMSMIALHNSKKTFLKKKAPFRGQRVAIKNLVAQYTFKDIPYGEYSLAVFHDENNNEDLDSNILGIPKEEYGFSNNVWKKYGPPSYKQTVFVLNEKQKIMHIKMRSGIEKE